MRRAGLLLAALFIASCAPSGIGSQSEEVLSPGETIAAKTPAGNVEVEALSEQTRRVRVYDEDTVMELSPRRERRSGSLGVYGVDAGAGLIVDEAQYDFATVPAFLFWLNADAPVKIYNDAGYVVGFGIAPDNNTDVDLYHVCIAGKPPVRLPGSQDALVTLRHQAAAGSAVVAWHGCARTVFDPVAAAIGKLREDFQSAGRLDYEDRTSGLCGVAGTADPGSTAGLAPVGGATEFVLRPGDRLTMHNENGTVAISADGASARTFDWRNVVPGTLGAGADDLSGHHLTSSLIPEQYRQSGALGVFGCRVLSGDDDYALTYEEAQLNFASLADFRAWRSWSTHGGLFLDYVYRNDGLLAGYASGADSLSTPTLFVNLYQICIDGARPAHLPGADDSALTLTPAARGAAAGGATLSCAAAVVPLDEARDAANRRYGLESSAVRRIQAYEAKYEPTAGVRAAPD